MRPDTRPHRTSRRRAMILTLALAACCALGLPYSSPAPGAGRWMVGDVHTHTWITDGSRSQVEVAHNAFAHYGVSFLANSEHGGTTSRDAQGSWLATPIWRWASLEQHSWPKVQQMRAAYADRYMIQGVEWNVPGSDHASVGIISNEPTSIAEFEYRFDRYDRDTSRAGEGLAKQNSQLVDAVAGVSWLAEHFPDTSYVIINHPNRKMLTPAATIRTLHDAAPDTVIGLEGFPGNQKKSYRSGYYATYGTRAAQLWGGADYTVARVGGVWDSMLGEGRRLWVFGNSDFHSPIGSFWPGEYTKDYTRSTSESYAGVVAGMRSGRSFVVTGGLVRELEMTLSGPSGSAVMGQTLKVEPGDDVVVTVRFRVPMHTSGGRHPSLHHLDLIGGDVHEPAAPGDVGYTSTINPSARLIHTWKRSTPPWRGYSTSGTWYQVSWTLRDVTHDRYVRLRGTSLAPGTRGQTDRYGNPLPDPVGKNSIDIAWRDAWLYSNPVFIDVK